MKSSLVIAFCTLMQLSPQYDCIAVFDILHTTKPSEYAKDVIARDSRAQSSSEELEFLKDNRIDGDSGSREETGESKRQQSKAKPPLYMKLVYDKISEATNYQEQLFSVPYKGLLLRAWLPLGITRESSSNFTIINFQQTSDRSKLGRFLQAQIILTLRSNIEVSMTESTRTLLSLHLLENQNVTTELIDPGTQAFYSFNITDYLNEKLVETVEHPVPVSFKFKVSSSGKGNTFVEELFDVQVEQPFIMFHYEKFPESFFPHLKKPKRTHRRRSRSLGATVTTTQQTKTTTTGRVNIAVLDPLPVNNATNATLPNDLISPTVPATSTPENANENVTINRTDTTEAQTQLAQTIRNNEQTILPTAAIPNPPPLIVGNKTIPTIASILPPTRDCCKRYPHVIIPEQVDWFDVIEPRSIDIGYCSGQCAYPIEYGASEDYKVHTLLIDRYRQRQEVPSNYPRSASCVPVKYLPISIFQIEDDGGIVVKAYQDVTVHTCGCR